MDYTLFQWYPEPGVLLTPAYTCASLSLFAFLKMDHSFSSYDSLHYVPTTPLLLISCPFRPIQDLVDLQVRSLPCTCTNFLHVISRSLSPFFSLVTRNHCFNRNIHHCNLSLLYTIQHRPSRKFDIQVCLARFPATLFSGVADRYLCLQRLRMIRD